MSVIAAYRRVLSNGNLSRLMFGEFVSSIGDWLYLVALLIVIYEEAGDPLVLGIVGAARIVPYIILSVPAGIAADRYDRRLILLVTDVARGVVMVLMAAVVLLDGPVLAIVVLAIVATCFSAFFSPAIGSYIPALVRDESELGPANSTWSTLDNLAFIIGPAVAGILIGVGGLVLAFLLNAISFLVVAAVLWRLPPSRAGQGVDAGGETAADGETTTAEPRPSLATIVRPVLAPFIALNVLGVTGAFVGGGLGVLTVVLAVDVLQAGDTGTGLLNAAVGIGGLVGAVVSTALVLGRRLAIPLIIGGVALAAGVAVLGQTSSLTVAMISLAALSAGGLLIEVVSTTLFQRIVPDAVRGRMLGAMETLAVAAFAVGSFVIPVVAVQSGVDLVLGVCAVAVAVSVLIAIPLFGRTLVQPGPEDAIRRLLLEVPLFAGLPVTRLEDAMAKSHVVPMAAAETVIRQGDQADRFYVIAEGSVEVTQRDPETGADRVLRQMGPGEVFGEIGLLTEGIRTATVTAREPGRLLALDGPDFLDLVGSGPGLTSRLLDLHRGATPLGTTGG